MVNCDLCITFTIDNDHTISSSSPSVVVTVVTVVGNMVRHVTL